jgi:hypothetical protein
MSADLDIELAGIIVSLAAVTVASVAWIYQKKQYELSAMEAVHDMVANTEARGARRELYRIYREFSRTHNLSLYETPSDACGRVRADFDIIGSMVIGGLVPKKKFFDIYGGLVIACWKALLPNIDTERAKRNGRPYMQLFSQLYGLAEKEWKKKYPNIDPPVPF